MQQAEDALSIHLVEDISYLKDGEWEYASNFKVCDETDIEAIVPSRNGFVIERSENPHIWVSPDLVKNCQLMPVDKEVQE